jgi:hypothetical protein
MSSSIEILTNANRLVLDQLDDAEQRLKAKEDEARQTLEACAQKREGINRRRQLIEEIERVQLESFSEDGETEAAQGEFLERSADTVAPARIADRLAFAVVKASQAGAQGRR